MAALARALGVMCMVIGGAGICLAIFNSMASAAEDGGGILLLITMVGGSLFLMTVGAIAGVLADIAESKQAPPPPVQ